MYFRLMAHHPRDGKMVELQALIKEHVEKENAGGSSRNAFAVSMTEPTISMVHAIQHEDFAAWEKHMSNRTPGFQDYASRMLPLIKGNPEMTLNEVISRQTSGKANYLWQTIHTPQPGAASELRRLLEERQKTSIQRGSTSTTLFAQTFSSTYTLAVGFSDLASMETYIKAMQADPATAKWGASLRGVSSGTARWVVSRVVVPFPDA